MEESRFEKQMKFLLEIDKAKKVCRQTYVSDKSRFENDAEHSWHACVMAAVLKEYFPEADLLKAMTMMLIHDIVEIYAGDTYCYDSNANKDKEERELNSAQMIYGLLPEDQRKEFFDIWNEFETGDSPEAEFCRVLDRLQPTMLNQATGFTSWKEHGVKKQQIIERNKIAIDRPEPIGGYIRSIIENAEKNGFIK
ncbi:MAG: HD domain-containing protein [Firmicutes bacterium]|nr:HD domain-containing protein [Bacillota bacterium]